MRQEIVERADGIPLFVEEMTKAVLEATTEQDARRQLPPPPSRGARGAGKPACVLDGALDRLGAAKEMAQTAAAIGREFSHELLVAVAQNCRRTLGGAHRLVSAGLLLRQGAAPHATYLFNHALVQDAAYGTLLRDARHTLHARIGETLEQKFPNIA